MSQLAPKLVRVTASRGQLALKIGHFAAVALLSLLRGQLCSEQLLVRLLERVLDEAPPGRGQRG